MKHTILFLLLLCVTGLSAPAQVVDANRVVLHGKDGSVKAFTFEGLDYMDFDKVGEVSVTATVVADAATDHSITVNVVPSADCASYTVTAAADGGDAVATATGSGAQLLVIDGLTALTAYTLTFTPLDKYGLEGTALTLTATSGSPAPKIGDYYYSDGTWSDGGLVSIDADGCNAVWAEPKPEPLAGKTVVGIVCVTDPSRIAPEDREAGYTRGYVIACKNAVDPTKSNFDKYPESIWYGAPYSEISVTKVAKIGSTCYERISGLADTREMLAAYPDDAATAVPMFHYCTAGFPVEAPAQSSGWFVPSTGQLWDCIANFCSGKVAEKLSEARTLRYDFTAYFSEKTGEPVLHNFMRVFEKVPAADKDDITRNDAERAPTSIALRSCNRYDTESAVHFNLGTDSAGLIEGMAGWFDEEGHARPMLAF